MRQRADVWSWIAFDGAVVGKYQNLRLPLPADDLSDLTLGPLHVLTKTPLRSYALSAAYDNGNRSDVVYESFTDPFSFSLGGDIGNDHYESMGRVTGSITVAGAETEVGRLGLPGPLLGAAALGHAAQPTAGSGRRSVPTCSARRSASPRRRAARTSATSTTAASSGTSPG